MSKCKIVARVGSLAFLVSLATSAQTQTVPDDRERELDQVRREISRLQEQMGQLQGEARARSHELTATEVELQLQRARLAEARKQRDALEHESARLEEEVNRLQSQLNRAEGVLVASTQRLQGWSAQPALRWLLADSQGANVDRIRWLRYLVGGMNERRQRFQRQQQHLARLQGELQARGIELADWVSREEARNRELIEAHRNQERELVTVRQRRDRVSTAVAALVERERRLAEFLAVLEGRSFADQAPIQRFRGILDAPVRGSVVKGFGPQLDPRYRTRVPHNGLEYVPASRGQPVRAVYPGEVVYAAPFQGFGPTVIIAHPRDVYTLYAGLAGVRVSKGDVVALQQPIGSSGSSLYFEIRLENRPQDPAEWVR